MTGDPFFSSDNVVRFFAAEVPDAQDDISLGYANDNACPYCGGVLAPGDKASDCSSYNPRMPRMTPRAWRRLEDCMMGPCSY
ncbi:hypothetical protein OCAR_5059 [Afipia carboxidovorans OM5]|uniref:Uncharacterized protein n=1 Tax=Afipia carboxidovorans (strain ATCC 49405 / DSM 1227 / KCTC 32145 / OM5) TaxID=504832 RepID=B6JBX8_AFIC5|nr:hypothetical protein [Afipia carboxidovorans]ACI92194.1 hypothetical protein OCAR_5059 [Afipia carboxidovorans OM5]AEI04015.1 hypothetical protein OCA4_c29040 [Afipia carboxidovorans OM4]AEI07593.1 hypothetical protein OCA5_c29020 [Afipia carboxidovorans OM5]BEV45144.1 hypothetical protein CRBSH125_13270 [Afipia carboxidovorans]